MSQPPAIRPEQPDDRAAIRRVHREAFAQPAEADLVDALRDAGFAEISLVAVLEAGIVGHILLSPLEALMRALALAPLAVRPTWQRRGIGAALVRNAMAAAAKQDWDAVFVVGDPDYYARFGFQSEAARGYDTPYPGNHFMVCALRTPIPRSGRIIYPAPFAALQD